jgi:glyoxylase-like metal-dependent hydrolase (beta-lactamase superfamily II)
MTAETAHKPALDYPFHRPPEPGVTAEVAAGVHWVRMPLPFPPDHINLWLLEDGDGWAIVDCGLARDETKAAWERIFADALDGRRVTRLFVTHFHPDHMGLAQWLTERWDLALHMTAAEWMMARMVHGQGSPADLANRVAFYRANGLEGERLAPFAAPGNIYRKGVPEVPSRFRRIRAGVPIVIGGREWLALIGRGHAPEHACLWCPELNLIIGGDILLPRISPNVSVWPAEPLANPLADYLASLDNFADLPERVLVLPAHGLPYRGVHERIAELRDHHRHRLDRLAEALDPPRSAADCFGLLFRREIHPGNMALAVGEALAHLHLLEDQGRAKRARGEDGVWRFVRA